MELVIAICGSNQVGKSSIIKSFLGKDYRPDETVQYMCIGSKDLVHIYLEEFRSSLSNPDGCIFVYDVTSLDSFSTMRREYQENGQMFRHSVVFGNKTDLDSRRAVRHDEVDDWSRQNRVKHLVGNSHTKYTIDRAFYELVQAILDSTNRHLADKFRNFVKTRMNDA